MITSDCWGCTSCAWTGKYAATKGVTYRSINWQHCPSCNAIAIPFEGSGDMSRVPVEEPSEDASKCVCWYDGCRCPDRNEEGICNC